MKEIQTSETLRIGILLALCGGFMDAYSYLCRGKVFANAQTGNMLLFGVYLSSGNWAMAFRYASPVFAFAMGIAIAAFVRAKMKEHMIGVKDKTVFHWRQITVFFEAIILFCVAFIPFKYNLLANSITSFACGMQVESFRKIHGNGIATTMCIGNLRNATQNLCEYIEKRQRKYLKKSALYYGIIAFFILGAVIGNQVLAVFEEKAIMVCSFILAVSFLIMCTDGLRQDNVKKIEEK